MSGFVYDGVRWLRASRVDTVTESIDNNLARTRKVTLFNSDRELKSDGTAADLLQRIDDVERGDQGIDFDAPSWTPPAAPTSD